MAATVTSGCWDELEGTGQSLPQMDRAPLLGEGGVGRGLGRFFHGRITPPLVSPGQHDVEGTSPAVLG